MHVLTKIFIVLVALLSILLVPLVVVYSTNENNYKGRLQEAEAQKAAAQQQMQAAVATARAEVTDKESRIAMLETANKDLENAKAGADASIRQLESQLAAATATQNTITGNIAMINESIKAGQQLTESLIAEIRTLRTSAVALERQKVELDEALRDVSSQLEVAEQARRALAEELARLKDEHTKAITQLGQAYAEGFGRRDTARLGGVRPDVNLTATIIRVQRNADQVLAEIDAGSRDGVKEGWSMTIASGGTFIANLRIINVDINRATGTVSLETKDRGLVQVGQTAHAVAGQK